MIRAERRGRARRLAALALLAAAACGDLTDRADARDAQGGKAPRWTLASSPELRIGAGDAQGGLHQVMSAVRLRDGSIAIANAGTSQVRIAAPDGRTLRSLGREGDGPGEFRVPAWIGARGDTLLVADMLASRVSRFAPDGAFLGSAPFPEAAGLFPQVVGQYRDGTLLVAADEAAAARRAGVVRGRTALLRLRPDGSLLDTLAVVPSSEQFASASPDARGIRIESLPFGRRTVMALHEDRVYVGTGETPVVRTLDPHRRGQELLRVRATARPVGAADIDDYWENLVTTGGTPDGDSRTPPPGIPYPRALPPYADLRVDDAGRVWVEESRLPREWKAPARWSIYSPQGRQLGWMEVPPRARILDAGTDWLLLHETDEDRREMVSLYRFSAGS